MKFPRQFTGVSCVEEEERETSQPSRGRRGSHRCGDPLCALVRNYSRARTGNRHGTVDRSCRRHTQPRSPVIWFESATQIASNVRRAIYRNLPKYRHDFAVSKVDFYFSCGLSTSTYILGFRFTRYMYMILHQYSLHRRNVNAIIANLLKFIYQLFVLVCSASMYVIV